MTLERSFLCALRGRDHFRCHVLAQVQCNYFWGADGALGVFVDGGPRENPLGKMNFLRGVMGGQSAGPHPSGAETVSQAAD